MAYTPCYPNKRNWANLPSESSPINETNLNAMDNAIYTNDGRIVELSGRLDTDETALGNKVDKQSGKGLSEIKSITISPSVNTGTKIAEISYKNQDNLTIGYEIKNGVVVDSALSSSSENPVQNKVVKTALDGKVDKEAGKGLSSNDYTTAEKTKLAGISAGATAVSISDTLQDGDTIANITIDGTTTAIKAKQPNESEMNVRSAMLLLSSTPIGENAPFVKRRSGGNVLFPALLKDKIIGASVVWNQLVHITSNTPTTTNYVTFTPNTDGSVTVSGTATATATYNVATRIEGKLNHILLLRGCPSGGSGSTFRLKDGYANGFDSGSGLLYKCTNANGYAIAQIIVDNGVAMSGQVFKPQIYDLTAMFGATIADYVNTLETQTAGSGIAWLKSYGFFTEPYYAYSANKIESVSVSAKKYTGKNLFDEIYTGIGNLVTYKQIKVQDGTYTFSTNCPQNSANAANLFAFSGYKTSGGSTANNGVWEGQTRTVTTNDGYVTIAYRNSNGVNPSSYNTQIELGSTATPYEPYKEWQTSLDHTALRGLFKLDANNNLYADGDIYPSDGTESVRYALYDMGNDMSWTYQSANTRFYSATLANIIDKTNASNALCEPYIIGTSFNVDKTILMASSGNIFIFDSDYTDATALTNALKGKKLLIKLATPTTASITPFNPMQNIENGGTEEFIDYQVSQENRDVAIPVGGDRQYYQGMDLPALPTASGNHNLQFNPSSGFSWS